MMHRAGHTVTRGARFIGDPGIRPGGTVILGSPEERRRSVILGSPEERRLHMDPDPEPKLQGIGAAFSPVFSANAKHLGSPRRLSGLGAVDLPPGWIVLSTVSMAASAFHGYRRNRSIGWALWWGAMGALFPIITPVIAVAQGYGKPDGR